MAPSVVGPVLSRSSPSSGSSARGIVASPADEPSVTSTGQRSNGAVDASRCDGRVSVGALRNVT